MVEGTGRVVDRFHQVYNMEGKPANGYTLAGGRRTKSSRNNGGPILYARKFGQMYRKKFSTETKTVLGR